YMQRLAGHSRDDCQIGLPHVAANEAQSRHHLRAESIEPLAQCRLGASPAHPKEAAAIRIDLVNDGEEVGGALAFSPVDLVDANGVDVAQLAVLQAPFHEPFDGPINRLPTGVKDSGGFAPRQ